MADHIVVEFEKETETGYDIVPVKIKKMRFESFHEVLALVNEIYGLLEQDPSLQAIFEELFAPPADADYEALENFTPEEIEDIKKQNRADAEKRFVRGIMGAFPLLTVHLPKQATQLLLAMTDVDEKLLNQQDLFVVMDVYDACLKVNNIEKLVDRIKKSSNVTKTTFGWLNLRRRATQ